jgi:3-oxoacyl-[acyl-carrier protein] reductase
MESYVIMTRLAGCVIIVTGAGQGIGKTLGVRMAREGALVVPAELHEENGIQVQKDIEEIGAKAITIATDVSSEQSVNSMVNQCLAEFGHIDALINDAGIYPTSSVEKMTEEEWDRVIETNLVSAFLCSKAVTPIMLAQRKGRIISITSEKAFQGAKNGAHYAASKAGIIGFTKALALELAPYGITVNAICPGVTDGVQIPGDRIEEELCAKGRQIPLGRIGRPEDLVGAAIFLASNAGRYVTGQTLLVNGGGIMW